MPELRRRLSFYVLKRRFGAASQRAARASGQGVLAVWRTVIPELGSRVVAIFAVAAGVYLAARALLPDAAAGMGLASWGVLTLAVALRQDDKALAAALKKALGE